MTTLRAARHLRMPDHHEVRTENINLKRLGAVLAVAYERDLHDFAELLLLENLGSRTLLSLALIAEVVHGAPSRFSDPARFSLAHGGKDRHPFPAPLKTYDESLNFLRTLLDAAKVGDKEKVDGFGRFERFSRLLHQGHHRDPGREDIGCLRRPPLRVLVVVPRESVTVRVGEHPAQQRDTSPMVLRLLNPALITGVEVDATVSRRAYFRTKAQPVPKHHP